MHRRQMNLKTSWMLGLFLGWAACYSLGAAETLFERDCAKLASSRKNDRERLHELLKLHWEYTMRENPEFATDVGYPGQNHRWPDLSLDAIERRKRELQAPFKVIQSIKRAKLAPGDQFSYDLFKKNVE